MSFTIGQTVTMTNNNDGFGAIVLGNHYEVKDVRDNAILITRDAPNSSGSRGWYPVSHFTLKDDAVPVGVTVGTRVRVEGSVEHIGNEVPSGSTGEVVTIDPGGYTNRTASVRLDSDGRRRSVYLRSLVPTSTEPETLVQYRNRFMLAAVDRGARNGGRHVQEVKSTLDDLARMEFIDPTETVEDFQKRIIALAFESKGKYRWCEEPEVFLAEFGLTHLMPMPVKKSITLTVQVEVTGESTFTRQQWRYAARAAVGEVPNSTVRIPVTGTVRNDI